MQLYWLWLESRKNITFQQRNALLERFSTPEGIFRASPKALASVELSGEGMQSLLERDLEPVRQLRKTCASRNICILTPEEELYPARLRHISDFPGAIYYRGVLPDFDSNPAIGVVGTRKASSYGLHAATQMGWQISRCGGIVVSGMASGIDGAATRGALAAGKTAVGVLGCGVDRIYPRENYRLYEEMLEKGCLISEFPPGTPAYRWNFPRRNRIISGLSLGVLVVEAPAQSGALITARQALEQGRDVFAVPGNIGVASCEGSNSLLRDGASMASSGWDVVGTYAHQYPETVRKDMSTLTRTPAPGKYSVPIPKTEEVLDKKDVDKGPKPPYHGPEGNLTPVEQQILAQLPGDEGNVDDIVAETGLSAGAVVAGLTTLRIKGYVSEIQGRRVLRTRK